MLKKTMLLALAIGALVAFAVPAAASAALLTSETVPLSKGAEVVGTDTQSEAWVWEDTRGISHCQQSSFQGEVIKNTEAMSEIRVNEGDLVAENCALLNPINYTESPLYVSKGSLTLRFEGSFEEEQNSAKIKFNVYQPNVQLCSYEGPNFSVYQEWQSNEILLSGVTSGCNGFFYWGIEDHYALTKPNEEPVYVE